MSVKSDFKNRKVSFSEDDNNVKKTLFHDSVLPSAVQLLAKDENWTVGTLLSFQFRKLCGWGLDFNEYLLKGNQTTILTYAFPREDNKTGFYIQGSVVSYSIYSRLNKRGQIKYSTFETVN